MAKFDNNQEDEGGSRPSRRHTSRGIPFIHEPRCSICKSQYRRAIDQMLVSGFSLANIAEHFERLGDTFTRQALGRHKNKHLTLHSAAIRRIVEKRAEDIVDSVDEHTEFLASKRAILEVGLQKGFENIMSGSAHIAPQDLLNIMEKLERMEAEEHSHAIDEMMRDFKAFADAVKMLVDEDVWPEIAAQYRLNLEATKVPVLEALVQIEAPPIDAEIVEDEEDEG